MVSDDELFNHCLAARFVFDEHFEEYGILFSSFPAGTCGNVSDLIGIWLSHQQVVGIECVSGNRRIKGGVQSHAWIEVADKVIDITSDQFSDGLGPVYFGKRCAFYESFKSQQRNPVPYTWIDVGVLEKFMHDMQVHLAQPA